MYSLGQVAGIGELSQVAFAQTVKVRIGSRHVCDGGNFMHDSEVCFANEAFVGGDQVQALRTVGWLGGLRECFKAGARVVEDHA